MEQRNLLAVIFLSLGCRSGVGGASPLPPWRRRVVASWGGLSAGYTSGNLSISHGFLLASVPPQLRTRFEGSCCKKRLDLASAIVAFAVIGSGTTIDGE